MDEGYSAVLSFHGRPAEIRSVEGGSDHAAAQEGRRILARELEAWAAGRHPRSFRAGFPSARVEVMRSGRAIAVYLSDVRGCTATLFEPRGPSCPEIPAVRDLQARVARLEAFFGERGVA